MSALPRTASKRSAGRRRARTVAQSDLPLALTLAEGRRLACHWLAEARIARDVVRLAVPPSRNRIGAGDRIRLPDGALYRVDRVELTEIEHDYPGDTCMAALGAEWAEVTRSRQIDAQGLALSFVRLERRAARHS